MEEVKKVSTWQMSCEESECKHLQCGKFENQVQPYRVLEQIGREIGPEDKHRSAN